MRERQRLFSLESSREQQSKDCFNARTKRGGTILQPDIFWGSLARIGTRGAVHQVAGDMTNFNSIKGVTKSRHRVFYFGALLGIVPGILTLSISTISILSANVVIAALQKTAVILIMPGLVGSMIASANVRAFSLPIAALINFAIYSLLGAVVFRAALSKKNRTPPD